MGKKFDFLPMMARVIFSQAMLASQRRMLVSPPAIFIAQ